MTAVYIDADHFNEMVKKELNGLADAETVRFLWQDRSTLNRWKTVLEEMKETTEELLKKWNAEYSQEEDRFQQARIYKLPEWNLFCEKHDKRMKEARARLKTVKERLAQIWAFFNENKEQELFSTIAPVANLEEVQAAIQEFRERQSRLLEYQEKQTALTELWGAGYNLGANYSIYCMRELGELGYDFTSAFRIVQEFLRVKVKPWIPNCRGQFAEPPPDFREFMYEHGYHTGPKK